MYNDATIHIDNGTTGLATKIAIGEIFGANMNAKTRISSIIADDIYWSEITAEAVI